MVHYPLISKGLWKEVLQMSISWREKASGYTDRRNIQASADPENWLKAKQWQVALRPCDKLSESLTALALQRLWLCLKCT